MSASNSHGFGRRWSSIAAPYAILRLSGQGLEFAGWIFLARHLGAGTFGELSIVFLVCRYAGILGDWGAAMRGPRDVASDESRGSIRTFIRLRMVLSVSLAAAAAVVIGAVGAARFIPVVAVILALGLSRDWIALGREQGARAAIPITVQGGLVLGVAIFVVDGFGGAIAIGAGYGAAALTSIALNRLPREDTRERTRIDAWMLVAVLSNQVTSSFDTVILGLLASTTSAGIYAAVYRIPNAWIAMLSALVAGLLPLATRTRNTSEHQFRELRKRTLRTSGGIAVAVAISAPVGALLVPVLFGPSYESGRLPALILLLATAVITLAAPLHPLAVSSGRDRRYASAILAAAVFNVVANVIAIPHFGMNGAAATTLATQVIILVMLWKMVTCDRPRIVITRPDLAAFAAQNTPESTTDDPEIEA